MTLSLPWTFSKDDPAGPEFENRLQDVFDTLGQQFPVSGANLANDVLRLATTGTSRKVAFGTGSVTLTASTVGTSTVTHGLNATPAAVLALPILNAGEFLTSSAVSGSATSTQVQIQFVAGSVVTITRSFYWLAIG
jgi:hypothetical protein